MLREKNEREEKKAKKKVKLTSADIDESSEEADDEMSVNERKRI